MIKENSILAIIAAAGIGQRFDDDLPKQYFKINGNSLIENAVKPFIDSKYISKIVIAISDEDVFIKDQSFYNCEKIKYVSGGSTRQESIFNALNSVKNNFEYVVTHDAARPNVYESDISRLCDDIVKSKSSCSYLYTPVYDSIREDDRTLDKSKFNLVQTPQICNFKDLKKSIQNCLDNNVDCPDESFAIEYSNLKLSKIKGVRSNIKVTEKADIEILNNFLTRSGVGFDLHKYEPGDGIILGGYKIPCDYKTVAHSDGDVLLHSIADSILGAAGLGDIGMFFSDQDNKNKNLDSTIIIEHCLSELDKMGLEIYNIDTTIVCENPKINPHRAKILENLTDILKIPLSKIGLKATTSEKIGIIGNNEAISVQSIVNLKDMS